MKNNKSFDYRVKKIIDECIHKSLKRIEYLNKSYKKDLTESIDFSKLECKIGDDYISLMTVNNNSVAEIVYNVSNYDDILSEYSDSVYDFDSNIMRKFNYNLPIVNIEDVWVYKGFQGQGLFRKILTIGLKKLSERYSQFILRACSDNGFPDEKLVSVYSEYGFIPVQETEEDGTIMLLIKN
jgi:hypothetical protein